MSGPKLLPRKATVSRQVFLSAEMWDELKEAAKFHSDTFKKMGATETVSRNDLIDAFLQWALESYWEDKGGRPESQKEWDEKVARHADQLRRQQGREDSSK